MTTDSDPAPGVGQPNALLDIDEPDDAYVWAAEKQDSPQPYRRALVVLATDHPDEVAEEYSSLCTELLQEAGFTVDGAITVRMKKSKIRQAIETAVVGGVDLVLTVGGVGVGPRDKVPEATREVLDQIVPGIAQAVRSSGQACGAVDACTSRGIAGVSGSTVVINLAPSRAAVRDGMATITPLVHHLVDQLQEYSV